MQLLDMDAVAERLGVTRRMVRKLWDTRKISGVKVGRCVRFTERDVDEYVERNRRSVFV